jgi:hypothetical protein
VAGKSVGCKTALIAHSEGLLQCKENPDIWAENLAAAVERILSDERGMDKPQMNEIHRNGPASHQFLVKEKAKVTRAKPD